MGGIWLAKLSVFVLRLYGQFTMETILAVAFGRVVGVQRGEADDLTNAAMQLFRNSGSRSGMMIPLILDQFQFLEGLVRYYSSRSTAAVAYSHLQRTAGELVKARRAMGDRQKEVLRGEIERGGEGVESMERGGGYGKGRRTWRGEEGMARGGGHGGEDYGQMAQGGVWRKIPSATKHTSHSHPPQHMFTPSDTKHTSHSHPPHKFTPSDTHFLCSVRTSFS